MDLKLIVRQWTSPSDHLPVWFKATHFELITWNILNTKWIKYIEKHPLKDSVIIRWHKGGLRDDLVVNQIMEWLFTKPVVICLQECSSDVLRQLMAKLKRVSIYHSDLKENDIGVIIVPDSLKSSDFKTSKGVYRDDRDHFIMRVSVGDLIVLNTHIPGGSDAKGPEELSTWLKDNVKSDDSAILVGDMNKRPDELKFPTGWIYQRSSYFTHINTEPKLVRYDHVWTFGDVSGKIVDPIGIKVFTDL